MKFLLDTNVISEARKTVRKRDPEFHAWIDEIDTADTAISVITLGEILAGVIRMERRDPEQGARLRQWYAQDLLPEFGGRSLTITREIAETEAKLQLPKNRPKADALIAATALSHGLVVVTRNVIDFDGTGVQWINPWTGASNIP